MDRLVMLCRSCIGPVAHAWPFVSSELPEEELKQDEQDEQAKEKVA